MYAGIIGTHKPAMSMTKTAKITCKASGQSSYCGRGTAQRYTKDKEVNTDTALSTN